MTSGKKNGGIYEILEHDYKDREHLQSIAAIPQIIKNSIYISSEKNEDAKKHPNVEKYEYYLCGLKISNEDYTVKAVVAKTLDGKRYYDHKLTNIEKGLLIETIKKCSVQEPSVSITTQTLDNERLQLKDKRLASICQVPQMPYLEQDSNGLWKPTHETVQAVKDGKLFIEKDENGIESLHYESQEENMDNENIQKQSVSDGLDKYAERMQENHGMSEAAMEKEIESQENPRPDYLDEQGNPHWFDEEENTEIESPEELPGLREENGMADETAANMKVRSVLKQSEIENLTIISQEEFNDVVDLLYQDKPDYRSIPNVIRLPDIDRELAGKLGIENASFFLKTNIAHVRPQRKGTYGQELRMEEMKSLLDFIPSCKTAYVDTDVRHQNFFLAGLDEQDGKKANKVVFNKDELGNYIVTIAKVNTSNLYEKEYTKVAVGVEPTIWSVQKERSPATMLRPSTTLASETIKQDDESVNGGVEPESNVSDGQKSGGNIEENSFLERSSLEKASDLLRSMKFNSENYKELVDVIGRIAELSGNENIAVEAEKDVEKFASEQEKRSDEKPEEKEIENDSESRAESADFSKIEYGKTVLPAFSVMADGKMRTVENAVVTGYDRENKNYLLENGAEKFELPKQTFEVLFKNRQEQEEKRVRIEKGNAVVFEDREKGVKGTVIPEWAMYTQNGLETFKGFVASKYNSLEKTYTLTNGDKSIDVTEERFREITASERFENKFDEDSPEWKKLCETQYKDYFEPRTNTAYNFRHNLEVYCRKEANSPCDALRIAKDIVSRMPKDERRKTKALLNEMRSEYESTNELIAGLYHEAVRAQPLNEDYIRRNQSDKVIARPFYDTVCAEGEFVEKDPALVKGTSDRNLKIGSFIEGINIQAESVFGRGKEAVHFDRLKVISASKEGNSVTLMDSDKSFIKLPRDTVLSVYKEQQLKEMKKEIRHSRTNSVAISY